MILAGDIGGTSTRLAFFNIVDGRLEAVVSDVFPSQKFSGLGEIVSLFLVQHPYRVESAAFGIAGPVRQGRVEAPNLPWGVEAKPLAAQLELEDALLLNDLEANTYGIAALQPEDFGMINPANGDPHGNIGVISAGTGLGESGAVWSGRHYHVFASEGGHSSFAPQNELEAELLLYLLSRQGGHISWERVVSGPGLYNIYQFLRDTGRGKEESWLRQELQADLQPSVVIARAGMNATSELCSQALDLLVWLYAAEAGNWALKIMATGGIFLGGGIAPRIISRLQSPNFMASFTNKGRMSYLLKSIPVRIILNDQAALLGAALYAGLQAGLYALPLPWQGMAG